MTTRRGRFLSKPRNACQFCPRGRTFAHEHCDRCSKGVCTNHVHFNHTTREWLCPKCNDIANAGKVLQLRPKSPRPIYTPWWASAADGERAA